MLRAPRFVDSAPRQIWATLLEDDIVEDMDKQGIGRDQITLHADRGAHPDRQVTDRQARRPPRNAETPGRRHWLLDLWLSLRWVVPTNLLLLALFAPTPSAKGEQASSKYHVLNLSIESGLSQSTVFCIKQDSHGYVWLGTEDGLNRFDGYEFRVYQHSATEPTTISDDWISDVHEDSEGHLWVVTRRGLDRMDRSQGTFERLLIPAHNNFEAWSLHEDSEGRLWLGGDSGLYEVRGDEIEKTSLPEMEVRAVRSDERGELWLATWGHGLVRYSPRSGEVETYGHREDDVASIKSDYLRFIYRESPSKMWVGTRDGLNIFDPTKGSFQTVASMGFSESALEQEHITFIHKSSKGEYWLGSRANGGYIVNVEAKTVTHLTPDRNSAAVLPQDTVWSIHEDPTGLMWLGLGTGGGLALLSRRRFHLYQYDATHDNSLSNDIVWSIVEGRDKALWVGTSNGLNWISPDRSSVERLDDSEKSRLRLSSQRIWALVEDSRSGIWAGTYSHGLNHIAPDRQSVRQLRVNSSDPASDRIRALTFDNNGQLLIGTDGGGLAVYDPVKDALRVYRHDPNDVKSISDDKVWAILCDADGSMWLGTDGGGVNRLNPRVGTAERFAATGAPGALSSDRVWSLHQGVDGRVWIGTKDGGLSMYSSDCNCFTTFSADNSGIPDDTVYGIQEDSAGRLWLSTNRGLSRFDLAKRTFSNYDVSDGLASNEFNFGAHWRGSNTHYLYFGGIKGVAEFDPLSLEPSHYAPPIVLTGLFKSGRKVMEEIVSGDEIYLDSDDNFFSVSFSSLDYRSPNALRYRYRLVGTDQEWRLASSSERRASYSYLPPGRYTLQVRGTNRDGIWSARSASAIIVVPKPFWDRIDFRISMLGLLLALLYIYDIHRKKVLMLVKRRLAEGRELEHSEVAHQIHEGPIQSVVVIRHQLEALANKLAQDGSFNSEIERIHEAMGELINDLRCVCWDIAEPPQLSELGLATAMSDYLQEIEGVRALPEVRVEVDDSVDLSPEKLIVLYRMFQKTLNNCLQHAHAESITITGAAQKEFFVLTVVDDGVGFDVPATWIERGGDHYGILSTIDLLESVGGRFEVSSKRNHGTRVVARIPLDRPKKHTFWKRWRREEE